MIAINRLMSLDSLENERKENCCGSHAAEGKTII